MFFLRFLDGGLRWKKEETMLQNTSKKEHHHDNKSKTRKQQLKNKTPGSCKLAELFWSDVL
jgi:hypothetical protein